MNNDLTPKEQWEEVYKRDAEDLPWLDNTVPKRLLSKFSKMVSRGAKILDYGCGDGKLAHLLTNKGLSVICSDISENALDLVTDKYPGLEVRQANHPSSFKGRERFNGILCWGVMHHVDKKEWQDYLDYFYKLLEKNGVLLIGGHSTKDNEFKLGYRISPTTGEISHAVDNLDNLAEYAGFLNEKDGYFEFTEAYSDNQRFFKYFFFRR